jgi:hypothetical protein
MKFLCRNCKAKYQIADDKVVGRTLRMTCQQCGEPIVVRSGGAAARQSQVSRPVGAGTLHGTGPMAMSELQRPQAHREHLVPQEEWHVAINDVPVGPMRRDEVARKIALNAIDRDSLAWREGMDDWLPIKHIPELAKLFPGAGGLPGGVAMTISGIPPAASLAAAPVAPAPAMHAAAPKAPAPAGASIPAPVSPSQRVEMAPVGGARQLSGFVDDYVMPASVAPEPVAVATAIPDTPASDTSGGGKSLGWGPMFALVSGGAFILAAGAFLGVRVLAPQQQPPPAPVAAAAPAAAAPAKPTEEPVAANEDKSNVIELDVQPIDGQKGGGKRSSSNGTSGGTTTSTSAAADGKKKELTAEQRDMLARMGGGLDQGGPSLKAPTDSTRPSSAQQGQLTAEQLSSVVLKGRKNLQRCYETALRGSNSSDTVRLDVEIEVSPNGNVTVVKANGKALPGMDECITRTVKMWRFPTSGEVTQTRFPVVFQPGA